MHGRSPIGSTFIQIAERYAGRLQSNGGKLMLSGVSQNVWDQLERTETFETIPESDVFKADETLGGSTKHAFLAAPNAGSTNQLKNSEPIRYAPFNKHCLMVVI